MRKDKKKTSKKVIEKSEKSKLDDGSNLDESEDDISKPSDPSNCKMLEDDFISASVINLPLFFDPIHIKLVSYRNGVLTHIIIPEDGYDDLDKEKILQFKKVLCCAGFVKDGIIQFSGDHRNKIKNLLINKLGVDNLSIRVHDF